MELASFIKEHWQVISTSPLTFIMLAIVVASVSIAVTRAVMGGALEAARERLMAAKDEINNLQADKNTLLEKLHLHGEDIAAIKAEISALPKVRSGTQPPHDGLGKDGDIYFMVEK